MMEGGETSSGFFREMKWDNLIISEIYGPGIVSLRQQTGKTEIVIKPGSYQWPETILNN